MKNILIGIITVGVIAIAIGTFAPKDTIIKSFGATGSGFNIAHEYIEPGVSGTATTTISTQVATTSPIYFTANSTSTITILTAGVADLRLNINSHATTTAEATPPYITITEEHQAQNGSDYFFGSELSTSGSIVTANSVKTVAWSAATTSPTALLIPESDNPARTSILFTNLNTPKLRLRVGSDTAADIWFEVVKAIPNQ